MKITVKQGGKTTQIHIKKGENLLKALHKNGFFITAYCGGRGLCKKCEVRFLNNPPKPFKIEEEILSSKLKSGFRLACLHRVSIECSVEIPILKPVFAPIEAKPCSDDDEKHAVIDIGTTTVAAVFIEKKSIINSVNVLNPQIAFGGDVISRISYSNEGGFETLKNAIQQLIIDLTKNFQPIKSMVVCANPTMLSFFLGLNPKTIGEHPYEPPFTGSYEGLFRGLNIYVPPVISAFLGSDITSALSILPTDKDYIFLDIGTNCEFLVKKNNEIFAASVPAGPALEGSGIDYGTIATDGAIYKVEFNGSLTIHTIGNKKATGITGSGLISAVALLRRYKLIDKTGKFVEPWETEAPPQLLLRLKKQSFLLSDNIYLTQKSIREFQLVKASLNAAFELLKKRIDVGGIDKVFISGGFSRSLTKNDIIDSGLLSFGREFVMLGNSAVKGGVRLLCEKERKRVEEISKNIQYIELANEELFEQLYIKHLEFYE